MSDPVLDSGASANVGGKAAKLLELQAHFPVPPFLVFPKSHLDRVSGNDLLRTVEGSIGPGPWAVRSSANVEDGAENTYAGMFETVLGSTPQSLLEDIARVLKSAGADRVRDYGAMKNLDTTSVTMNVVIQVMVDADVSGVALSRATHESDGMSVVEAIFGLGEGLVSGAIEPDTYIIRRETGDVESHTPVAQHSQFRLGRNGVDRVDVRPLRQRAPKLNAPMLRTVLDALDGVEQLYRSPMDIEFAFADREFFLLQARALNDKSS